jgi:hypothetical protein
MWQMSRKMRNFSGQRTQRLWRALSHGRVRPYRAFSSARVCTATRGDGEYWACHKSDASIVPVGLLALYGDESFYLVLVDLACFLASAYLEFSSSFPQPPHTRDLNILTFFIG